MNKKKYIEDSLLLTKEAFAESIYRQRVAEAASYGLTLEEYQNAIVSGSVVQSSQLKEY